MEILICDFFTPPLAANLLLIEFKRGPRATAWRPGYQGGQIETQARVTMPHNIPPRHVRRFMFYLCCANDAP